MTKKLRKILCVCQCLYSNPGTYQFDPQKMHGNDLQLTECEVYRVEGLMEKPWRNVQWNSERRQALLSTVSGWKPSVSSVKQARILLVGPVGAGKSSSSTLHSRTQEVSTQLGVSLSAVVPVKNYFQELEIDSQTDILLLNAAVQMLRAAEGYFDDFYNPEERSE
ncbi:hypothetical protein G5714_001995 [Onychostoma macrolepis]|uniref:Uncharacterized protein n=1 Tax=Onychostoma macrolepis TaxID=369639 RepID=A0A7J6DDS5_9TELE|nr:hypothetical protein G5714_001995 [Onychostoma macrolepis]